MSPILHLLIAAKSSMVNYCNSNNSYSRHNNISSNSNNSYSRHNNISSNSNNQSPPLPFYFEIYPLKVSKIFRQNYRSEEFMNSLFSEYVKTVEYY